MEDKSIAFQERDPQILCLATDVQKTTCGPGWHPCNSNPKQNQQHNLGKNIRTITPKK
jgi:Tat protein secretion system quality control protein TatD with DNase activity